MKKLEKFILQWKEKGEGQVFWLQILRDAHKENDSAVMAAYGFSAKMTELEIVVELLKLYQSEM